MHELIFLLLLIIVAALYASIGHGGASGYLALMAIFGMAPEIMRPSALTLNLFVAGIAETGRILTRLPTRPPHRLIGPVVFIQN